MVKKAIKIELNENDDALLYAEKTLRQNKTIQKIEKVIYYASKRAERGWIIHSDRGSQYTSTEYRTVIQKYGIVQSMNSAGGRCESMWARMKEELFYSRDDKSENYTMEELKTMIWRYFMSYWANRRICTANDGLPPAVKRRRYYNSTILAA